MFAIANVVAPVFLLIAAGFLSVRLRLYPASGVGGLVAFVNNFATPCLLFRAMLLVDFRSAFDPQLLLAFYIGAFTTFAACTLVTRGLFRRNAGEAVTVGFAALFSNTVLVGLPIMQRAYGEQALPAMYAIIGLHAPLLISVGMVTMELSDRGGRNLAAALRQTVQRVVANPLLIGIALGLAGNFAGLDQPEIMDAVTGMMAAAVLPTALFGLGGALNQYRLREAWTQALVATGLKLLLHPTIALVVGLYVFDLPWELARVAVLTAAMPAGLNVYVFATHYGRATDVAANAVLISTIVSVLTISFWLVVLEGLRPV